MEIPVENDHVAGACTVCLACDRPRDLGVFDQAGDDRVLARLDVRADAHGQLCVALEAFVGGHGL